MFDDARDVICASSSVVGDQFLYWLRDSLILVVYERYNNTDRTPIKTILHCRLRVPEYKVDFTLDREISLGLGELFGETSFALDIPLGTWQPLGSTVISSSKLSAVLMESNEVLGSLMADVSCPPLKTKPK